jgi:hypothetical protein
MRHPALRRFVLARASVAVLVVLTLTACGGNNNAPLPSAPAPSVSTAPVDPAVKVSGLPTGTQATVTDTSVGVENGDNLDFVSPVYTLAPAGPVGHAVTVQIQLDNALPTTTPLVIASRASANGPWAYAPGRLTPDQRHVEFRATSLNQVGVLSINLDGALASFQTDIQKGFVSGLDPKAKKPTCAAMPAARKDGYTAASSKAKTLFWCFGLENNKRVLKITNRMLVPLQVAHPKVAVIGSLPKVGAAYAPYSGVFGSSNTFMTPGSTVTYDADLQPVTSLTLTAASNAAAQSLRVLQPTVRALVTRLARFGVGAANVQTTVKALLAMPQCAKALSKGATAVVAGCLTPTKLTKLFGSRAVLLTPLVTAPAFPVFMRAQVKAMAAKSLAQEHQRIVVRRAAPDFSAFVGTWNGHARAVIINAQGLVLESFSSSCCGPVVDLTYQLTLPETVAGKSTAAARITKVKVTNRKLLKGRVPRVGDAGTITVRRGVVLSPFLQTKYCDAKTRKQGFCGPQP